MVLQLIRLSCSPAARASPCASRARSANHALRARTVLYEHARIQAARRIVTPEQSDLGRSLLRSGRCCRASSDSVRFENVRPHALHWYLARRWPKLFGV